MEACKHLCDGVGVVSDDCRVLAALRHPQHVALDEMTDADVLGRRQTIVDEQTEVVDETAQVARRFQAVSEMAEVNWYFHTTSDDDSKLSRPSHASSLSLRPPRSPLA